MNYYLKTVKNSSNQDVMKTAEIWFADQGLFFQKAWRHAISFGTRILYENLFSQNSGQHLWFELAHHPSYSPDLAPLDFCLKISSNKDVMEAADQEEAVFFSGLPLLHWQCTLMELHLNTKRLIATATMNNNAIVITICNSESVSYRE